MEIKDQLRDILLCAVYSGNDWDLDEVKEDLQNGAEFIDTIQKMKEKDPLQYEKLQQQYLSRWKI